MLQLEWDFQIQIQTCYSTKQVDIFTKITMQICGSDSSGWAIYYIMDTMY